MRYVCVLCGNEVVFNRSSQTLHGHVDRNIDYDHTPTGVTWVGSGMSGVNLTPPEISILIEGLDLLGGGLGRGYSYDNVLELDYRIRAARSIVLLSDAWYPSILALSAPTTFSVEKLPARRIKSLPLTKETT